MGGITEEDLSLDETSDEIMDPEDAEVLARESLEAEERTTIRDLLKKIAKIGVAKREISANIEHQESATKDLYFPVSIL